MAEDIDMNKQSIVDFSYFENNDVVITSDGPNLPALTETVEVAPVKKRSTKKKSEKGDVVEETSLDKYSDNIGALQNAILQYDILANEFKTDLDMVRNSRTLKGKFHYAAELGQTLNSILSNKVNAIKELNNVVKNAQEFDYKKYKDSMLANQNDDDRRLMDMYNAFIGSPISTGRGMLGPTESQMTIIDQVPQYMGPDAGYQNYLSNMTPEQTMMLYENDPNVQQVVTYNEVTGEKHFQVMNVVTGEVIPNAAHHDDSFLEGITIDPRRGIARNPNLNESYKLVTVNNDINTKGF